MRLTLAIHTYRYAIRLKRSLEQAGIKVWLQDVNTGSEAIDSNKVYAGIRVRIEESDLPAALHLVESETLATPDAEAGRCILVPIDFSRRGLRACLVAARLSLRSGMKIVLLHACPTPYFQGQLPAMEEDADAFAPVDFPDEEIEEVRTAHAIENNANVEMKRYTEQLRRYLTENGLEHLPAIETVVLEGVPEEVIYQYYREHSVALVVMSTRDTHTRSTQLIGSVTAEVVDNARISVITVPDVEMDGSAFRKILMFCTLDQTDLLLADYLIRMAGEDRETGMLLVPMNERADDAKSRTERLAKVLTERYPQCTFTAMTDVHLTAHNEHENLKRLISDNKVSMVALANKRRNILSRIFNPGLAHKVLFTNDVPLFALSTDESV